MKEDSGEISDMFNEIEAEIEYIEDKDDYISSNSDSNEKSGIKDLNSETLSYCIKIISTLKRLESLSKPLYAITFGGATKRLSKKLTDAGIYTIHINSDIESIKEVHCQKKIYIQNCSKNNVRKVIYEIYEEIYDGAALVIIGSLGGRSSVLMKELLKFIKSLPLPYGIVVMAILPFSVESARREHAINILNEMRKIHEKIVVLDNDSLLKERAIVEEFSRIEDRIVEFVLKIKSVAEDIFNKVPESFFPESNELKEIVDKVMCEMTHKIL